jgi:mycothiol synthase
VPVSFRTPDSLDAAERDQIRQLAQALELTEGAPPLSDQGLGQLGSGNVVHVLAQEGAQIVGYAQLDRDSAEILGEAAVLDGLLDAIEGHTAAALQVWAHGQRSPLKEVAERRGYVRERVLWQLRWTVTELPPVTLAEGVTLRSFVPGRDEDAWLQVNAAAFVHHPEQGSWTIEDIRARESEAWFDPSGFLLAERDSLLLGFHWTKVHNPTLGEVYVLGVTPAAQGLHLGSALLVAGLRHLREQGVTEVLLYVDDDNTVAMRLYEQFGFNRYDHDVQYRRAAAS